MRKSYGSSAVAYSAIGLFRSAAWFDPGGERSLSLFRVAALESRRSPSEDSS